VLLTCLFSPFLAGMPPEARKRRVGNLEQSKTPPQGASSSNSTKVFLQGKTSNSNPSEEMQRMTRQAKDEVSKRRLTEERLSRIEEDYRNLQRQHKSSASTLTGSTIPPVQVSLSVRTENQRLPPLPSERLPPLPPDSVWSSYTPQESNASSDVGMQLLQVLRDATSTAGGGGFGAGTKLMEEYPDGHTMRTFYKSLVQPWDIIPPETGPVKEHYKVRDANKDQFAGDRINFPVWRRRFLATVHSSRMLILDKALALSMALDKKNETLASMIRGLHYDPITYAGLIAELERLWGGPDQEIAITAADLFKGSKVQLTSLESVRALRVKLASYRSTLETYGKREAEFSPNSQLYREIQAQKFTLQDLIRFNETRSDKGWPDRADGILSWLDHHQSILEASQQGTKVPIQYKDQLNTAFTTIADHRVNGYTTSQQLIRLL
jgi:hypothetical protein